MGTCSSLPVEENKEIFILRNIIEQANEWQASLYINFIDFEKAFDSIHRESLWLIMRKYGLPNKIVRMVKVFYEDFNCAVEDQAEACEWFSIKTGVKQGMQYVWISILDSHGLDYEKDCRKRRKRNQVQLYI